MSISKGTWTFAAAGLLWLLISYITGSLCWFQSFIGIPCPACGSVRAVQYLIQGNWRVAFTYHPLILVSIMLLTHFAARFIFSKKSELYKTEKWIVFFLMVIYIGLYAVRMFLFFPHTEPFVPLADALWRQGFRLIASLFNFAA